jgi:hypothetical protein
LVEMEFEEVFLFFAKFDCEFHRQFAITIIISFANVTEQVRRGFLSK